MPLLKKPIDDGGLHFIDGLHMTQGSTAFHIVTLITILRCNAPTKAEGVARINVLCDLLSEEPHTRQLSTKLRKWNNNPKTSKNAKFAYRLEGGKCIHFLNKIKELFVRLDESTLTKSDIVDIAIWSEGVRRSRQGMQMCSLWEILVISAGYFIYSIVYSD